MRELKYEIAITTKNGHTRIYENPEGTHEKIKKIVLETHRRLRDKIKGKDLTTKIEIR